MNLEFTLNNEEVTIQSEAETRLAEILRTKFNLSGVKAGCYIGQCGACSVLFNGTVVKSCLIPAFKIRGSQITTIEGFSKTENYGDIVQGFSEAGLENCAFCNTGKILCAEALLKRKKEPSRDEIISYFQGIKCRCTEPEELVQGVLAAVEYRKQRLYG